MNVARPRVIRFGSFEVYLIQESFPITTARAVSREIRVCR